MADWLTIIDHKDGSSFAVEKNPFTGQWKHPRLRIDICGTLTSSNMAEVETGARYDHCLQKAGAGTDHPGVGKCQRHHGNGELASKRAKSLMRDLAARSALRTLAVPIEVSPTEALMGLVYEAAGNVAFLGGRVADLGLELVGDVYSLTREGDAVATSEDARAIVKLYNDERDRLAKVAKLAIDAGLEERAVRVLEDQAVMIAKVLRATIMALELPPETQVRAFSIMAQELRALGPGV